jgi:kynureninase
MQIQFTNTKETAISLDNQDELLQYKEQFYFPKYNGNNAIYFCGNSLGLQPKIVEAAILQEIQDWKILAISGFSKAATPWLTYQETLKPSLAKIVGAKEREVTVMNTLTVNLHLLLLSFYKPTKQRFKIIMEAGAFPSDQYAVQSMVALHGFEANDAIVEIEPKEGSKILQTSDILQVIEEHKESVAIVLLGGINYYTGQLFNMQAITEKAHTVGAIAGFDLAHVVGNVPTQLHNWNVDFACWCSYKYLNGGPGAVGGLYVHEKHATNIETPRLTGWWGNEESERFKMDKKFVPKANASGWNISTAQILNTAALKASLTIFEEVGIEKLRAKSIALTNYLEYLLKRLTNIEFEIITPSNTDERGAQLCLYFKNNGKQIHNIMQENGIVVDYREPGVIRVAPAPLYCSFMDVYTFYKILQKVL